MKTLDLRPLTPEARNAAINEAVMPLLHPGARLKGNDFIWIEPDGTPNGQWRVAECLQFASSCDAVNPLFEEWLWLRVSREHKRFLVQGTAKPGCHVVADHESESVAKCLALLRANGVEVLT